MSAALRPPKLRPITTTSPRRRVTHEVGQYVALSLEGVAHRTPVGVVVVVVTRVLVIMIVVHTTTIRNAHETA